MRCVRSTHSNHTPDAVIHGAVAPARAPACLGRSACSPRHQPIRDVTRFLVRPHPSSRARSTWVNSSCLYRLSRWRGRVKPLWAEPVQPARIAGIVVLGQCRHQASVGRQARRCRLATSLSMRREGRRCAKPHALKLARVASVDICNLPPRHRRQLRDGAKQPAPRKAVAEHEVGVGLGEGGRSAARERIKLTTQPNQSTHGQNSKRLSQSNCG